jgi:hypothetical protein
MYGSARLLLNTVTGSWCNLLRVRKSGVLSRHIHPSWVTGYVIKGAWRYLEHDWVAREGAFVYEPPGEIHTLVVDEVAGVPEMITFFNIHGAMIYLDEQGQTVPAMKTFSARSRCAASTMRPMDWAPTSSSSSCAEARGRKATVEAVNRVRVFTGVFHENMGLVAGALRCSMHVHLR